MLDLLAHAGRVSINHTAKHLCEAVTRKSQEDPIYPVLTPHLDILSKLSKASGPSGSPGLFSGGCPEAQCSPPFKYPSVFIVLAQGPTM